MTPREACETTPHLVDEATSTAVFARRRSQRFLPRRRSRLLAPAATLVSLAVTFQLWRSVSGVDLRPDSHTPALIAAMGVVMSLLLGAFTELLVRGRLRALRTAAVLRRELIDRRAMQDALREAEVFARATIDAMGARICVIDSDGTVLANNATWRSIDDPHCPMMGCKVGENFLEHGRQFLGSDLDKVDHALDGIRSVMQGSAERFSFEHTCCEGERMHWFACHVTRFANDVHRIVVVHEDISERKNAESSLSLAAMVYRNSSEAMVVCDANGQIIDCNPAFTRITGFTAAEVLGKNPRVWSSGRQDKAFYEAMWRSLGESGVWEGEIWNRRKDGEEFPEWLTINAVRDDEGVPTRYVALFSDLSEKRRSDALIWTQVNFDSLTNLPNRNMCQDRLAQDLHRTRSAGATLALLMIDLDHFKAVNDTLGHYVGDAVLVEAARRIAACIGPDDLAARFGGDEFTVILANTDRARAGGVADAITQSLARPYVLSDETVYGSASLGVSLFPADAETGADLLKNAEQAMYEAKAEGRNRFSYFSVSMRELALTRQSLGNDLRVALAEQQLEVYFQPIVELASGKLLKAEALLRWHHPQRGMVSPSQFVPIAEESGLINAIGDWVFRQSALAALRWSERLGQAFQVSVNKSPVQFMSESSGTDWLAFLEQIGLPGTSITVEITEGLLLNAGQGVNTQLARYRDAGISVSIDDFGTGYSAMSYLKKFPLDYLKVDQSFVRDMEHDAGDRAIVEAIIGMAHRLGFKVVAEGIETPGQRALLLAAGCDYGQGFLFSPAVPARAFESMLDAGQRGALPWSAMPAA